MKTLILFVLLFFSLFSKAYDLGDTLRGSLSKERTCYDVHYYDLNVDIDTSTHTIKGWNEIAFKQVEKSVEIQIDLFNEMKIDSIMFNGVRAEYARRYNAVFVFFRDTLIPDQLYSIKVFYHGHPIEAKRAPWDGGFVWEKDKNDDLLLGVACEGVGASLWWPNKDHLSDEPDSMRITSIVPKGFTSVSNGVLESQVEIGDKVSFTWKVSYPINNYNVTLNVAKYVHFSDFYISENDTLNLDYYVLPYNLKKAKQQFKQVKPMLSIYEKLFGKYPFWNDGYKLIETSYLGMEHQGAIAYGNKYRKGYLGMHASGIEFDYIIIHESGHEYWGNSVSVQDIADLWIHEGFCTYTEGLYVEQLQGKDDALRYWELQRKRIKNDAPLIGTYGLSVEGSSDMYNKGALMLHTLRTKVDNDSLWFATIRGVAEQFKLQNITTKHIENYIALQLNMDLTDFFNQYLRDIHLPVLELEVEADKRHYNVKYRMLSEHEVDLPAEYSISKKEKWVNLNCSKKWQTIRLSKKEYKRLQFNNNLILYDVKLIE